MKKTAFLLALSVILAGCASQVYGNQLSWRPKNSSDAPYVITSRLDNAAMYGTKIVHVFINGDQVISGPVSQADHSGSFVGKYRGHTVALNCNGGYAVQCEVTIDNEKVGNI